MRRQAFTLIELLVSISIIALLIAILLPILGKSREAAQRGLCLSQQRQIGLAMSVYASDHKEGLCFGIRNNLGRHAFYVWQSDRPYALGVLTLSNWSSNAVNNWKTTDMLTPQSLYCPSSTFASEMYDAAPSNDWSPWNGNSIVSSYSMRAMDSDGVTVNWRDTGAWQSGPRIEYGYTTVKRDLPKIADFTKNVAVLADTVITDRILAGHVEGVNVLLIDGSARWQAYEVVKGYAEQYYNGGSGFWDPGATWGAPYWDDTFAQ